MWPLILACLLALVAAAQTPSIDQSLSAKSVGNAEISPDGHYVAYTVQQADWDENEFAQQIWIANADESGRYQLTSGRKSSQSPLWSPDWKRTLQSSFSDLSTALQHLQKLRRSHGTPASCPSRFAWLGRG